MSDADDANVAAVLEMAAKSEPSESVLLSTLTPLQVRQLAAHMIPIHVPKGKSPTDLCDTTCAILVRAGSFCVASDYAGEQELQRLAPGEMYGEYQFLSGRSNLTSICAATDDASVSIISHKMTIFPAFGNQAHSVMARAQGLLSALFQPGAFQAEVGPGGGATCLEGGVEWVARLSLMLDWRSAFIGKQGLMLRRLPSFEEYHYVWEAHETNAKRIPGDMEVDKWLALKALASGRSSLGYSPSFSHDRLASKQNMVVSPDGTLFSKDLLSPRVWGGVLLEPPLPETPGEVYVEFLIARSVGICEVLMGVCGGTHNPEEGQVAWQAKDGYMFYPSSGYKFSRGKRLDYGGPSKPVARQAKQGDVVGLLVCTHRQSRSEPSGVSVAVLVNGHHQGAMFVQREMEPLPAELYFAVDLQTPGCEIRLIQERVWRSQDKSVRFLDATWDARNKVWVHQHKFDRTSLWLND